MHLTKVPLTRILRTGPEAEMFIFTYRPRLDEIVNSIRRAGLLHPPLLLERPETGYYQIICGSRRIEALCQLGKKETGAFVAERETCSDLDCFRWSLLDNRFYRGFNEIERAMLFIRFQDTLADFIPELEDVLVNDLSPPKEPEVQAHYRSLLGLSKEIKDALALGEITMGHAILILKAPKGCQDVFFSWIVQYKLNTNEAKQAILWATEVAARERKDLAGYVTSSFFQEILASQSSSRHRARLLLQGLRKERFPLLEQWKIRFEVARKKGGIGKSIQVIHDPFFETAELTFQIRASSQNDLKNKLRTLLDATEEGRTVDLFQSVSVKKQENDGA
jgi:ParB/RepB/Spo0J family partition protein